MSDETNRLTVGAVLRAKQPAAKEPVYWIGEVPTKCQLSGKVIKKAFVDGRVPGMSSWAFVHPKYFEALGGKLGLGCGQRYEKQENGRWLKVEG